MKLKPKNWSDFQHYKDRRPIWIKLHRSILDDFEFHCLPDSSKAIAPMLWLIASEFDDGIIDASIEHLAFRLRIPEKKVSESIKPLIDKGYFTLIPDCYDDASNALAPCYQNAPLEEKRREEKIVDRNEDFEQFWTAYPRKVGKGNAERAWAKVKPDAQLLAQILAAVATAKHSRDWRKDGGQFIPHPTTWINGKRWLDAPLEKPKSRFPI